MKSKIFTNPELAQKAHYRLLAKYGLQASTLIWLDNSRCELVVYMASINAKRRYDKMSHFTIA